MFGLASAGTAPPTHSATLTSLDDRLKNRLGTALLSWDTQSPLTLLQASVMVLATRKMVLLIASGSLDGDEEGDRQTDFGGGRADPTPDQGHRPAHLRRDHRDPRRRRSD